jgi:hypothetical protein
MAEVIITEFRAETGQFTAAIDKAEQAVTGLDQAEKDAQKSTASLSQQLGSSAAKANVHKTAMGEVDKSTKETAKSTGALGGEVQKSGGIFKLFGQELSATFPIFGKIAAGARTLGASIYTALGPIGLIVGAVALAFAGLVKIFAGTQEGSDKLAKVTAVLGAVFDTLLGVAQKVGKVIVDAFSDPQQAVEDLWEIIKTNITNRITAVGDQFKFLGEIIAAVFTLDSDRLTEGVKGFGNATAQALTGIENLADKVTNGFNELGKEIGKAADIGLRIAEIDRELRALALNRATNEGRITRELEEQRAIVSDVTKSSQQRAAAAAKFGTLQKQITKFEKDRLDLEIERGNLAASTSDTLDEEKIRLAGLVSAKEEANAREIAAVREVNNQINGLNKAAADKAIAERKRVADEAAKLAQDRIESERAVAEIETAINTARLDEIGKRDAAVVASFDKQVEAAHKAYTELATLAAPEDRAEIEQRQADAVIAINTTRDAELARLREQDLEGVRDYAKTKEEIQAEAVNAEFDAQKTATERIIEEGAERTEILTEIERNRQAALGEIRTEAEVERLAQQEAANEAELNAIEGFAAASGALIAGMAQGQEDAAKEFGKASLSIAFDAVNAMLPIWSAQILGKSVASLGPAGIPAAAALTALLKGVLAGLRATLGFADGGEVTLGSGPRVRRSNGDNVLATLQDREIVLSRASRARAERVFGRGVWGELGVPGFGGSIDWSAALARVGAMSAAGDGGRVYNSSSVEHNTNHKQDDRRIIGAIGGIGSLREQRRQTELLEKLTRTRGINPRSKWA